MIKRVLIAVGGTGGHVYPAIALAQKLKEKYPDIYIMFAGGGLESNNYFDRKNYPYRQVACGYFPLKNPLKCLASLGRVISGVWQSEMMLSELNPDIVVGFGSYHSLPILLAAKRRSIPIVLHEANAIPGKVNRLLSRHALATGLHFPEAAKYLKGKTVEVGMPLRSHLNKEGIKKSDALEYYGLEPNRRTIMIFGGSQGAFAINKLALEAMRLYTGGRNLLQVLHMTGDLQEAQRALDVYNSLNIRACVKDFEPHMGKAWSVADLAIGRAGAGTIAEAIEFEVPAILIPYPYASEDHQSKNADFMVEVVGGAIKLVEKEVTPKVLSREIDLFFAENGEKLRKMKEAIINHKSSARQHDMCSLVSELIPSQE